MGVCDIEKSARGIEYFWLSLCKLQASNTSMNTFFDNRVCLFNKLNCVIIFQKEKEGRWTITTTHPARRPLHEQLEAAE